MKKANHSGRLMCNKRTQGYQMCNKRTQGYQMCNNRTQGYQMCNKRTQGYQMQMTDEENQLLWSGLLMQQASLWSIHDCGSKVMKKQTALDWWQQSDEKANEERRLLWTGGSKVTKKQTMGLS
ncbi:hypothetical protein CAPTEDRAFT_187162 [Capitella teleta]|uniref:Uncharacterized protein n=1 Tax=Capitella teleta TaxID=283909 RepID=R7VM18_CAPTE|nr:hypothetical protein CAPTEDRAFT_187162 [Capitella teleta]|eukprot:ELU18110.1 hypothetical protein CAPTEDRAFT_187162 [Capitella teleta]